MKPSWTRQSSTGILKSRDSSYGIKHHSASHRQSRVKIEPKIQILLELQDFNNSEIVAVRLELKKRRFVTFKGRQLPAIGGLFFCFDVFPD